MGAQITESALKSLADKIDSLDLTADEQVVLGQLLVRAANADDVSGYDMATVNLEDMGRRAKQLAFGVGLPLGVTDEVLVPDEQGRVS